MTKKKVVYQNFETHHSQRNYVVFYFYAMEHADYFESCLIEKEIEYERGTSRNIMRRHMFGVHMTDKERVMEINNHTNEFFRKPFLQDLKTRNFVLIFTLVLICLAIAGYFISKP